jgi:hypothetical protein
MCLARSSLTQKSLSLLRVNARNPALLGLLKKYVFGEMQFLSFRPSGARAGIHLVLQRVGWIPACAGMTCMKAFLELRGLSKGPFALGS